MRLANWLGKASWIRLEWRNGEKMKDDPQARAAFATMKCVLHLAACIVSDLCGGRDDMFLFRAPVKHLV